MRNLRAWNESQKYMAYQGTPDLETLSSFIFHFGEDIIMESTEVKDYNDKEIYEGDILSSISNDNYPYVVKFVNGEFCLYTTKFGRWGSISRLRDVCDKLDVKINVIGNIYANPEMWQVS